MFAEVLARVFLLEFWLVGLEIRRFFPRNGMAAGWSKHFPLSYISKNFKAEKEM